MKEFWQVSAVPDEPASHAHYVINKDGRSSTTVVCQTRLTTLAIIDVQWQTRQKNLSSEFGKSSRGMYSHFWRYPNFPVQKQGVALTGRNRTGPPCRPTTHAPGPPAGSVTDDDRQQKPSLYAKNQLQSIRSAILLELQLVADRHMAIAYMR